MILYSSVHTVLITHTPTKLITPTTLALPSAPRTPTLLCAPFALAGNVVANGAVGFGPPDTVTVGAPDNGEAGEADEEDARMVKRGDTA